MWWLRRSISTTSASACRSACAAAIPAKPPPMITTRLRSRRGASVTAVAASGRLSANIALMDHLVRALCRDRFSNSLSEIVLSMSQPFGFARASRREHRSEGAGSPRQDYLVGHPLIRAQRRLRCEQVGSDVCVLVGRSCSRLNIVLVANAERIQPQQGPGQRNGDPIAAALDRPPAQRRENADCAEPAYHIVANGDDWRRFGMRGCPLDAEQPRYGSTDLIKSDTILPRAFVAVENDTGMDQSRLLGAERFGIEAIPLEIARAPVGEEDVGILQQAIEFRAIVFGVVKYGLTHPNLCVPDKRLHVSVLGPPDVEDIGPVAGEISAYASSGDHVPHSERANAIERAPSILFEGYRIAFADLLHADQGHPGEHFGVLKLLPKFLEGAHHGDGKAGFCCGVLQLFGAPLQDGIVHGFDAGAAGEEVDSACV